MGRCGEELFEEKACNAPQGATTHVLPNHPNLLCHTLLLYELTLLDTLQDVVGKGRGLTIIVGKLG